jgi:signal transduction histidine kinase
MSSLVSSIVDGLRRAGLVLLVGALAGLAVYAGGEGGFPFEAWSPVAVGNSVLVGILYVALIDATVRLVRLSMEAFVPVQSTRAVAYHALAPAAGVLVVFVGLTATLKLVLGPDFATPWSLLLGVGAVVALAVAGGTGYLALQTYHQHDRRDHAEGWETRMRRLRTQTCPPVLFDTLDAATQLIDETPEETKPLLDRLQALLRYRHRAAGDDPVRLADELEAVLWYVELAQVQHGDALEVGFDVPDPLLTVPVPRLSLLPLLENAVQHGAAAVEASCTITVTGRYDDEQLCLAVLDTGPGFDTTDPETVLRRGSGIADLYARLRDHYGPAADLTLLPQGVLWCAPIAPDDEAAPSAEAETETPASFPSSEQPS